MQNLFGKVQRDAVCGPGRDAGAEEICIFGPDWTVDCHRARKNGPIVQIARADSNDCLLALAAVDINAYDSDDERQAMQQSHAGLGIGAALLE